MKKVYIYNQLTRISRVVEDIGDVIIIGEKPFSKDSAEITLTKEGDIRIRGIEQIAIEPEASNSIMIKTKAFV